jgi:hypothetical protein
VRDAIVATILGSALAIIALAAGSNTVLAVVFMGAVALGVSAALRIGRSAVACAIAAELSILVVTSADHGVPASLFATGGVALASGLVVCAVAVHFFPWSVPAAPALPRRVVAWFAALVVPITMIATLLCVTVFVGTHSWWLLVTFYIVLMPSAARTHDRVLARVIGTIAGALAAGLIVALAGGTPRLVALVAVLAMTYFALAGKQVAFAASLTLVIVLAGSTDAGTTVLLGIERIVATIVGGFAALGVVLLVSRQAGANSATPSDAKITTNTAGVT